MNNKPVAQYYAQVMPINGAGVYRRTRRATSFKALNRAIEYSVRSMREAGPYMVQMYKSGKLLAVDQVG